MCSAKQTQDRAQRLM